MMHVTQTNPAYASFHPAFIKDIEAGWQQHHAESANGENYLHQQQAIASRSLASDKDEDGLRFSAMIAASKCKQLAPEGTPLKRAFGYLKSRGITPPIVSKKIVRHDGTTGEKAVTEGIRARLCSEKWWLRKLRNQQAQAQELQAISLGFVTAGKQVYISNHSLSRALMRQERNLEWLKSCDLIDTDTGEVMPMMQAVDAGISNPNNRRNEMMLRISDGEKFFATQGKIALFLTLTAPSKFHQFTRKAGYIKTDSMGVKHTIGGQIVKNPKYRETIEWRRGRGKSATIESRINTPRLGHEWLSVSWARLRAALKHSAIQCDFMRVTEPHHDGATHWHCIAFVAESNVPAFTKLLWSKWLREDADEAGAKKYRVDIVRIDPKKGRAASYIAKYISKNIDGASVTEDFESGLDAAESSVRVHAWRTTHVIRAFQFSRGFGQVGIWRELRRIKDGQDGIVELARVAADHSDYLAFLTIQSQKALQPLSTIRVDNPKPNLYGEITSRVIGLEYAPDSIEVITHTHTWEVVRRVEESESDDVDRFEFLALTQNLPLGVLENNCRYEVAA
jgi:hypothetical protein